MGQQTHRIGRNRPEADHGKAIAVFPISRRHLGRAAATQLFRGQRCEIHRRQLGQDLISLAAFNAEHRPRIRHHHRQIMLPLQRGIQRLQCGIRLIIGHDQQIFVRPHPTRSTVACDFNLALAGQSHPNRCLHRCGQTGHVGLGTQGNHPQRTNL